MSNSPNNLNDCDVASVIEAVKEVAPVLAALLGFGSYKLTILMWIADVLGITDKLGLNDLAEAICRMLQSGGEEASKAGNDLRVMEARHHDTLEAMLSQEQDR